MVALEKKLIMEMCSEAHKKSTLRHANIVQFLGVVLGSEHIGVVTEYTQLGDLQSLMRKSERDKVMITESIILRMILDTICGLRYLHELNPPVIHGGLKSTNVMIDVNWRCKLADYGLGPLKKIEAQLQDTESQGSLLWLAPEVLKNPEAESKEGDVYAFGIILFELLYREVPYKGIEQASLPLLVNSGQRPTNYASSEAKSRIMQIDAKMSELMELMNVSYDEEPDNRPTATDLRTSIERIGIKFHNGLAGGGGASWQDKVQLPQLVEEVSVQEVASNLGDENKIDNIDEDLKVGTKLGAGSYGVVSEGMYRGTRVAAKKLHVTNLPDEMLIEFHHECEMMREMRHPNLVLFMGSVAQAPVFLIITELMAAGSLRRVIKQLQRPYPMSAHSSRAISVAKDVARGGAFLHLHNPPIIHGDLKSDNILLDMNWNGKICDFGLSRFKDAARGLSKKGTPLWCAPEVLRGDVATEAADVYSFAMILWEVCAWAEPYQGESLFEVTYQVANEGLRPKVSPGRGHPLHPLHPLYPLRARTHAHTRARTFFVLSVFKQTFDLLTLVFSSPPKIPAHCNQFLSKMITTCWDDDPEKRPAFVDIIETLDGSSIKENRSTIEIDPVWVNGEDEKPKAPARPRLDRRISL